MRNNKRVIVRHSWCDAQDKQIKLIKYSSNNKNLHFCVLHRLNDLLPTHTLIVNNCAENDEYIRNDLIERHTVLCWRVDGTHEHWINEDRMKWSDKAIQEANEYSCHRSFSCRHMSWHVTAIRKLHCT